MVKAGKNIKKQVMRIKGWIKENRREAAILGLILLVGAFLRLYKISEYMTFLGDEGRDAIIVRRLITDFDPILIGPRTSIGDMYLGPLYYYMMAPALALFLLSPVGPAVMIALLGVATIFFVWFAAREWFPLNGQGTSLHVGALIASGLYAVSPVVITHARHSWNPNIMPFFALLVIYAIWKVWSPSVKAMEGQAARNKRFKWLIVAGISYAFVLQSHYLGLLLAPTIAFFWLLTLKGIKDKKKMRKDFVKYSLLGTIVFVLLMSPLVIFDSRYGWRNFVAMEKFFTERQTTVSARPWTAIPKLPQIVLLSSTRLIAGKNEQTGNWMAPAMAAGAIVLFSTLLHSVVLKKKISVELRAYFLIIIWIGIAYIGLGIYKQHIYDHYYGFFFTAPFLFIGGLVQGIVNRAKNIGKIIAFVAFALLVYVNLSENPLKYPPNRQMQRTMQVAEKISQEARGKRFNLAVIAERNYEDAYQYFLEKWREPVVDIDPLHSDETITEQLFVVCELPKDECDPTHDPKAEIANFGWSKVDNQWEVGGVILYRLIHTQ